MNVSEIIEKFGGRADLAAVFELSEKAVWQWERRNRIPGRWHLPLLHLARERGVPLSDDELLSTASRK